MLKPKVKKQNFSKRRKVLYLIMLIAILLLIGKAVYLQIVDTDFLQKEARNRHISKVKISAYRGQIKDKNGESLAVSAPVDSVWVNPQYCYLSEEMLQKETRATKKIEEHCQSLSQSKKTELARILGVSHKKIERAFNKNSKRRFVYLKRRVSPLIAQKIKALDLPGVGFIREFKRFYPAC